MRTQKSGAKFSAIVKIGEDLKLQSQKTREEFLYLNRGINQVVNINLSRIIPKIDFNSNEMQYYAHSKGMFGLRKAINKEFFLNKTSEDNIYITSGGMNALFLVFQTLEVKKVYSHSFYWGAYSNVLKISKREQLFYNGFDEIIANPERYENSAVIICDPNNPTGSKTNDDKLFQVLEILNNQNTTIVWDGPYRRLFYGSNDTLYKKLLAYENVIITESFSKSIGLSGQRLGFMHSQNKDFNDEFAIRLLYSGNGINAFAQILTEEILTSEEGKKAANNFKQKTVEDITKNIKLLKRKKLLAEEFYEDEIPVGIFVIVNKSFEELKQNKIGSVSLNYFTQKTDINVEKYARICVSVPKEKFKKFFEKL